jgi:Ni,Fe-hydrogenase III large subunit/Ni,Fe-hydrogenase III component G
MQRVIEAHDLETQAGALLADGYRLALSTAHDEGRRLRVVYLFLAGPPDRRVELHVVLDAADPQLPSLAALSFPAGRFERELCDLYGVTPVGHPQPRRLVLHAHWPDGWHPLRADAGPPPAFDRAGAFPFAEIDSDGAYEIPVGPVHAGLIEPGHFRFTVVGESVLRLKARLWYVHRGVLELFTGRVPTAGVELAERISGDTSVGHAIAYCAAVEDALGIEIGEPAARLRALLVELERLYNHAADLGALANDVGFGLANAHALRVREMLLRVNESVTGHRLLRDAVTIGGVRLLALPDLDEMGRMATDLAEIAELTLGHSVIRDRFTGTAVLTRQQADDLGCLGYVARASGRATDARIDHPSTPLPVEPVLATTGDVLARYTVRRDEFRAAADLIAHLVGTHAGPIQLTAQHRERRGTSSGVGIVEGWRGTIVHRVEIDGDGRLSGVAVVDPSWFNWPALALTMTDAIVPDFPLANKSFNQSYAGNDL